MFEDTDPVDEYGSEDDDQFYPMFTEPDWTWEPEEEDDDV